MAGFCYNKGMKFETNKQKGNSGLGVAIGYFMQQGYIVSIPINDTQCYDLAVDIDGKLNKVQVKATGQKDNGVTVVNAKSSGGTNGGIYQRLVDTDIDLLFVTNEEKEMWLMPKEAIKSRSTISLGSKYAQYRVSS